jgi:hypothetical protein
MGIVLDTHIIGWRCDHEVNLSLSEIAGGEDVPVDDDEILLPEKLPVSHALTV